MLLKTFATVSEAGVDVQGQIKVSPILSQIHYIIKVKSSTLEEPPIYFSTGESGNEAI